MREFTKSMASYTWAMSLFGLQQMINIFRPGKATESFNNVTKATEEEFGDAFKGTFRAGDNLQKGLVDVTSGILTLGTFDRRGPRPTVNVAPQTGEAVRQSGNVVGQTADILGQALQAATQTVAVIAQSMAGGGSGCGGSKSQPTGWGPVPPPPNTQR